MKDKVTLYIATHNITGKKYFGKTVKWFTQEDLQKNYHGSGVEWREHLKEHTDDVTMEIYGIFSLNECDEDYVKPIALRFSYENNIFNSLHWLNMVPENGLDGGIVGQRGVKWSIETRDKLTGYVNAIFNGEAIRVTKDEFRNNRDKYTHHNDDKLQVIDICTGKRLSINSNSFDSTIHKHYSKDKVSCIVDGINKLIDIDEFKEKCYDTNTTNKTTVKDKNGKTFLVDINDQRYLSGELVGVMKDTVTVKDKNGIKYRVNYDDPRYLSGELKGVSSGMIWINNGINRKTIEQNLFEEYSKDGWYRGKKLRVNS